MVSRAKRVMKRCFDLKYDTFPSHKTFCNSFLCPFNRLTRLISGVIVKDSPCSKHVDTGISPESAPDRSELLTISPNLDESVDAVRAFQKRQVGLISKTLLLPVILWQLSDSKISSVKKSSGQAVKAAHATASGYDGPM